MATTTTTLSPKLQALIEKARANHAARTALTRNMEGNSIAKPLSESTVLPRIQIQQSPASNQALTVHSVLTSTGNFRQTIPGIEYNERQIAAVELAMQGKDFNMIGAAGTGKTTTTREIIGQLIKLPHITPLQKTTKWLTKDEPGIVVISFTNKAVNNLKKFLPDELKKHCLTYHKLLEYKPKKAFDEMELDERGFGGEGTSMFIPTYYRDNPLPHISCVIIEESSMVAAELHEILLSALPNPENTQFIFLGDLNQLPPIFGPSILGFKLTETATIELTHVYRQALLSPIITLAHKIREGRGFSGLLGTDLWVDDRGEHGKVTIRPWKKKIESGPATKVTLANFLIPLITGDSYDFENTAILCPFNKSFGTIELNKSIADALGKKRNALVYEVVARYQRSYWAVGDRVLVDRREAKIVRINPTPGYSGQIPLDASTTLNRWGIDSNPQESSFEDGEGSAVRAVLDMDILDRLGGGGDEEGGKNLASHTIGVEFIDTGIVQDLSSAGDINGMLFSYVLTVHKSQGSEWKKVIILLHYSHNSMLSRELLYTAVTRARDELFIICEPDRGKIYNSITKAAKSPEIAGVTLKEKAAYFQGKKRSMARPSAESKQGRIGSNETDAEEAEEM